MSSGYLHHHKTGLVSSGFLRVRFDTYVSGRQREWIETPKKKMAMLLPEKNMPETAQIPAMLAGAETLDQVRAAVQHYTRCDLCRNASQAVFGEGPPGARLMIVGEQPSDQEDLAGLAGAGVIPGRLAAKINHKSWNPANRRALPPSDTMSRVTRQE